MITKKTSVLAIICYALDQLLFNPFSSWSGYLTGANPFVPSTVVFQHQFPHVCLACTVNYAVPHSEDYILFLASPHGMHRDVAIGK